MAPKARKDDGSIPPPGRENRDSDRSPFLRIEDIGAKGSTVVFDGTTRINESEYGAQILCGVSIGRDRYVWGIKTGSKNHRTLHGICGGKIRKGLSVSVKVKEFTNTNGEEIRFVEIQKPRD